MTANLKIGNKNYVKNVTFKTKVSFRANIFAQKCISIGFDVYKSQIHLHGDIGVAALFSVSFTYPNIVVF